MPLLDADISIRYSVPGAAAGDADPSNAVGSLGGFMSTTVIADAVTQNIFDNVTAAEATAGRITYRCIFFTNINVTDSWDSVSVWLESQVALGGTIAIGLDLVGPVPGNDITQQAAIIASETAAPAGVTFSSPTSIGTGLVAGAVAAGECFAVWLRLTVPAGAAPLSNDGAIISARSNL